MKQKNPNNLQVKPQTIKCIIGGGDKKKIMPKIESKAIL